MKKLLSSLAIIGLATLIISCSNQDIGMTSGAVVGGVAGSALSHGSTAGTVAGAVGGGFIGRQLSY